MNDNLCVAVLGHRNSGKSLTWNTLFRERVRTGRRMRRLFLTETQYVEVFLVSGSSEERHLYVGDIIGDIAPRIVLCSMQYHPDVRQTIQYFRQHDYFLYLHWLNPGYSDRGATEDTLDLVPIISGERGEVHVRDGQIDPTARVQEMRKYLLEWASSRSLLRTGRSPVAV
jgi:hypothetical protein